MTNKGGWEAYRTFFISKGYQEEKVKLEKLSEDLDLPKTEVIALAIERLWKHREKYKPEPYVRYGRLTRTQKILQQMEEEDGTTLGH